MSNEKTLQPGEYARLKDVPTNQILSASINRIVNVGGSLPGVRLAIFVMCSTDVEHDYKVSRSDPAFSAEKWNASYEKSRYHNAFWYNNLSVTDAESMIRATGWRGEIEVKQTEEFCASLPALDEVNEQEPAHV